MSASVKLSNGKVVKLGRVRIKNRVEFNNCVVTVYENGKVNVSLRLAKYLKKGAGVPPLPIDWTPKAMDAIKRMYLNDTLGDCVIASAYHQLGVWSGNESGTPVQATDQEVGNSYTTICGPGDQGCVITDVLDYTQKNGLVAGGTTYKIDGYVSVDWTNWEEVLAALYLFGSIKLGINLPSDWTCTDCTWDVTNSGVVGGHDVPAFGATDSDVTIATWGGLVKITKAAFTSKQWIEEAYVPLSPDWYKQGNLAPNGVDVATLRADLQALGGGTVPPIPTPVPPAPPAPPVPPGPNPTPAGGYNVNLQMELPLLAGNQTVTITGTVTPQTSNTAVNWLPVIMDVVKLVGDVVTKNPALLPDLLQLLKDLGL